MFYWLQVKFQKHFRWLFIVVMVIVCVSFVFTVGNFSFQDVTAESNSKPLDFYGYNLNSSIEIEALSKSTGLEHLLNHGRSLDPQSQQTALLTRAVYLSLADQLQLGNPTMEQTQEFLRDRPFFKDSNEKFDPQSYNRFLENFTISGNFSQSEVIKIVQDSYRIAQVKEALMGPGYALSQEAERLLQEQRTDWKLQTAYLDYAKFSPEILILEDEIEEYYQENKFNHRTPEKIKSSYVQFDYKNFVHQIDSPSEELLRAFFMVNSYRFDRPDGVDLEKTLVFEDIDRTVIEKEYRNDKAQEKAEEVAYQFITRLYEDAITYQSGAFTALLKENGLTLVSLEAFPKDSLSKVSQLPAKIVRQLTELPSNRYFTDVEGMQNGVQVAFLEQILPAEIPPLENIKQSVIADLEKRQKDELFALKGESLVDQFKSLKSSQEFFEKAEQEGLVVEEMISFVGNDIPSQFPRTLLEVAKKLRNDEVSSMKKVGNKGYFVFLIDKKLPEIDPQDSEVKENLKSSRQLDRRFTEYALLSSLIDNGIVN